jgi:hypothetical protein
LLAVLPTLVVAHLLLMLLTAVLLALVLMPPAQRRGLVVLEVSLVKQFRMCPFWRRFCFQLLLELPQPYPRAQREPQWQLIPLCYSWRLLRDQVTVATNLKESQPSELHLLYHD